MVEHMLLIAPTEPKTTLYTVGLIVVLVNPTAEMYIDFASHWG